MGLFKKFRDAWFAPMSFDSLDDDFYDRLEESLILADVGMDVAMDATEKLRRRAYDDRLLTADQVKGALRDILAEKLEVGDSRLDLSTQPSVILVIGVNGVGKTTSIGKMAHQLKKQGKKVLLCAGDTFRAAAADQLEIWADRAGVDIVRQNEGADPGAVLFEPVELSLKGYHIILIKPDIFVSTRDAFAEIKPVRPAVSLKEIVKQPMETWKNSMKNDFEDSVFKKFPEIAAIKDELYDLGAVYAAMSGSGSSVYGIFKAPIENVEDKFCGCFCRQRALE